MRDRIRRWARYERGGWASRCVGLAIEARAAWWYFTHPKYTPKQKMIVLGSARSGSTLLVDLIGSLEDVTCYGEILHDKPVFLKRHIHHHYAIAPTEVFGFKLLPCQCIGEPLAFLRSFDGYRFVYVRRENPLRQAISSLHARASKEWHTTDTRARGAVRVDIAEVWSMLEALQREQELAETFLARIPHVEVIYERDLEPNENPAETLKRVAEFLGVPFTPPKTSLKKRLPGPLSNIVENYDELEAALLGTEYEIYLK